MKPDFSNDRGEINFVKVFLVLLIGAAAYLGYVYLPLYSAHFDIRQSVREAAAASYRDPRETVVLNHVLKVARGLEMKDTLLRDDGTIETKKTPFGEENVKVSFSDSPREVTVEVTYERQFVLPVLKKQRSKEFTLVHTLDLSQVDWGK